MFTALITPFFSLFFFYFDPLYSLLLPLLAYRPVFLQLVLKTTRSEWEKKVLFDEQVLQRWRSSLHWASHVHRSESRVSIKKKHQFTVPYAEKVPHKTHTVQTLINDAKDQRESHYRGEKYREGGHGTVKLIWRQIHRSFFTMDSMYRSNLFEAKTKKQSAL